MGISLLPEHLVAPTTSSWEWFELCIYLFYSPTLFPHNPAVVRLRNPDPREWQKWVLAGGEETVAVISYFSRFVAPFCCWVLHAIEKVAIRPPIIGRSGPWTWTQ